MSEVKFTPEQLKRLAELKAKGEDLSPEEKSEVVALETLFIALSIRQKKSSSSVDRATLMIFLGFAVLFAALIATIALVGLFQNKLDPAGVITLLGGIFTGLVPTILILKSKGEGGKSSGDRS